MNREIETPPCAGRRFYLNKRNDDGTVDVYLMPDARTVLAVRGVVSFAGMEKDIRTRYEAWCASAERII